MLQTDHTDPNPFFRIPCRDSARQLALATSAALHGQEEDYREPLAIGLRVLRSVTGTDLLPYLDGRHFTGLHDEPKFSSQELLGYAIQYRDGASL